MKNIISIALFLILGYFNFSCRNIPTTAISNIPSFDLLLLDSSTIFNSAKIQSGSPTIFLYFNTDCPHCQAETKSLLEHIDSLGHAQLYFLTGMSFAEMKKYNELFHLSSYKNITVGKDYGHSFAKIFKPRTVPYIAIYNSQKRLVKIYKEDTPIKNIFEATHS